MILTCHHGVFQSHTWDTATGLSTPLVVAEGSEGSKVCPYHIRMNRAREHQRLLRQRVLTIPCFHCNHPVPLVMVKSGKAARCPTCIVRAEKMLQEVRELKTALGEIRRNARRSKEWTS